MANVQIAIIDQENTQIALAAPSEAQVNIAVPGIQGPVGQGVPNGGAANQVLFKQSGTDYDTAWSEITSDMIGDLEIVDADVSTSAAIAGTKISPDFGSQAVVTTGTSTAASFIPTGSTVPTNGIYSPSANQLALSTGGTGRLFVDASGNVGVGTSSISFYQGSGIAIRRSGTATLRLEDSGLSTSEIKHADGSGLIVETLNSRPIIFSPSATERMRLDSSGRLGLGTSSPDTKLEISNGSTGTTSVITALRISGISDDSQVIEFKNNHTSGTGVRAKITSDGDGIAQSYGTLKFWTGRTLNSPSVAMKIDSLGRVGIGTTSPVVSGLTIESASSTQGIELSTDTGFASGPTIRGYYRSGSSYRTLGITGSQVIFGIQDVEKARIDSSGRLLVGTSSEISGGLIDSGTGAQNSGPRLQVAGTDWSQSSAIFASYQNAAAVLPQISFNKSKSGTLGTIGSALASGDGLGAVVFSGSDGTKFVTGASISAYTDGTCGANDLPSRLVFSTTADGASSPTERMRINNAGGLKVSNNGTYPTSLARHEIRNTTNDLDALFINHTGTSGNQYGLQIQTANDQNDTTRYFITCYGGATTQRATIRSNGGFANYSANNVNLSDRNAKKDITPAAGTWDCLKEWEIVNFRYKDQTDDAELNMGVIAQQVAESCPEVITVFQEATEDQPEKLGVKDQQMMWMAIKALQEAQLRIETLEAEVAALKAQ